MNNILLKLSPFLIIISACAMEQNNAIVKYKSQEDQNKKDPSAYTLKKFKDLEQDKECIVGHSCATLKRKFDEMYGARSIVTAVQESQNYRSDNTMNQSLKKALTTAQMLYSNSVAEYESHMEVLESFDTIPCHDTINLMEPLIEKQLEKCKEKINAQFESFATLIAVKHLILEHKKEVLLKKIKKAKTYNK